MDIRHPSWNTAKALSFLVQKKLVRNIRIVHHCIDDFFLQGAGIGQAGARKWAEMAGAWPGPGGANRAGVRAGWRCGWSRNACKLDAWLAEPNGSSRLLTDVHKHVVFYHQFIIFLYFTEPFEALQIVLSLWNLLMWWDKGNFELILAKKYPSQKISRDLTLRQNWINLENISTKNYESTAATILSIHTCFFQRLVEPRAEISELKIKLRFQSSGWNKEGNLLRWNGSSPGLPCHLI